MELSSLSVMLLLISLLPVAQAEPKPTLRVNSQSSIYPGDTVTLSCELQQETGWRFLWYKNYQWLQNLNSEQENTLNVTVDDAGETEYRCRAYRRNSHYYTDISDPVRITARAKPKPTLRVNPQSSVYTGDTVTLSCELQQGSGWRFYWYKNKNYLNSEQANTLQVTVDDAGETEYRCRAYRRNSHYYTYLSDPVRITARAEPKPIVRVNPQSSIYPGDTVTLSCELQQETGWRFYWYKNNQRLQNLKSEQENTLNVTVHDAGETEYQCEAYWGNSHYYSDLSEPVRITARERPGAVLSVSPQSCLTEGDSVTLSCEVRNSSTDWTFSWYTPVPYTQSDGNIKYKPKLLTDSSRGSGGNYTLSPAALHHTGVYMCRGERGEPADYTQYSNPQPVWITGESPPVALIFSPDRTQHFTEDSLSLSCEDQSNSTGWTVRRYTHSLHVSNCSRWGSVTGSTCYISFLSTSYTGVYWCESESGESSNPVNITVQDGDVILESPVHPVTEGHPLTLRCLYRNPKHSNLRADFYKDGSVLQKQTTAEMILKTVSKLDEGFYYCKHPERGESPKSWISIRPSTASGGPVGLAVGLGFLFFTLLILMILLWACKRKKEKQPTSVQNPSRSGAEDSQSGHTPLQTGNENIYSTVDQADTSRTDDDVTYADIKLQPIKEAKRTKEKPTVADDTVYSKLSIDNMV